MAAYTQDFRLPDFFRHARESGYPFFSTRYWISAYAGMTESENPEFIVPTLDCGNHWNDFYN